MPSKSKAQARLMAAAAHNPAFAKKVGVPTNVAKEFNQADKGRKFRGGGMAKNKLKDMFKGKESYAEELKEAKAIKSGKITPQEYARGEKMEKEMQCGGKVKKMALGGLPTQAAPQAAVGMANRPAMPAQSNAGGAMRGLDRAAAMSGRTMPTTGRPMKAGGSVRGCGIAQRGKTKGRMV